MLVKIPMLLIGINLLINISPSFHLKKRQFLGVRYTENNKLYPTFCFGSDCHIHF
jgi:hypothetical protein